MIYLWLFYVLVGMSKISTTEPLHALQSTFKIIYRIRIYQGVGSSREQWREMIPPDVRDIPSTETKERCAAGLVSPSVERKTTAEQLVGPHGKLLTWSDDGTMFAYVDRNPAIAPPQPNLWGCDDCFFPDLKVIRASDGSLLATIRLPEFGEHWNYPENICVVARRADASRWSRSRI